MSLAAGLERPQGVDLDLNKFDLSATHKVPTQAVAGSWAGDLASAFWKNVDGANSMFDADDANLLRAVFNPYLSDRRAEGDFFLPPDASFANMKKLRNLTKSEEVVRSDRREHFLSEKFNMENAGPLFPVSWRSSHEIESKSVVRTNDKVSAELLKSATVAFDNRTEDGMRFRVYRSGSMEVRTVQEHADKELVGAVFKNDNDDLKSYILDAIREQI